MLSTGFCVDVFKIDVAPRTGGIVNYFYFE